MKITENNPVVKILMKRDSISLEEAIEQVESCAEGILEAIESGEDPEEVILNELGLEPDYIFDIIDLF